ncbi:MAG: hypothetical protein ACR2PB_10645 [Desulfocapsaceae bacterium]
MKINWLISLITLALITGCTSIGPSSIERDRFEYSTAIAESWKEMMLLNIIKIRYGDTPMFLEVGSVVNQYILERELEAIAGLRSGDFVGDGLELGGKGKYSDRPTITYSPLIGEKFYKSLLTPIPPHALFLLIQSGWNADFLLRVCLTAINDLYNSSEKRMSTHEADEGFDQLLEILTEMQKSGGMGSRLVERQGEKTIIFFRHNLNDAVKQNSGIIAELLGLDPNANEYRLVYGSTASDDREIAMLTRSMFDIIAELSQYVAVPAQHVQENRASPGAIDKASSYEEIRSRIFIKSGREKPEDPFLTVKYRDHWFYIEDTDFRSKRMFSFLLFLLSLAEGGGEGLAPVLTLPTG